MGASSYDVSPPVLRVRVSLDVSDYKDTYKLSENKYKNGCFILFLYST